MSGNDHFCQNANDGPWNHDKLRIISAEKLFFFKISTLTFMNYENSIESPSNILCRWSFLRMTPPWYYQQNFRFLSSIFLVVLTYWMYNCTVDQTTHSKKIHTCYFTIVWEEAFMLILVFAHAMHELSYFEGNISILCWIFVNYVINLMFTITTLR